MRVIAGELKGHRLATPRERHRGRPRRDRPPGMRPTSERVREAIFSILGDVRGARVLDLCCGTGALGIEALSRGARHATFVDPRTAVVESNTNALKLRGRSTIARARAWSFLAMPDAGTYDLVLCDPPYRLADRLEHELDRLLPPHLAEGARVIVECSPRRPLTLALPLRLERRYGDTMIRLYQVEGA